MPQVRVLEKSFINNSLVEAGEVVEYDGELGTNLELVEGDKPKRTSRKPAAPAADAGEEQPQDPAGE